MRGFCSMGGLLTALLLCSSLSGVAQKRDSVAMYGVLDTVQVVRQRIRHANEANAGARVSRIDPEIIQANKTRSMAELLTDYPSVYIKSLGMGALSTASFRGAGASQTRVNWNGINITPPMSGTFDFSQIPVFFTDNISLYYGSSHVKNGTGAIGGSVNFFTDPVWQQGVSGKVLGEVGSYGTHTGGGQVNVGTSRASFKTRYYYQHSDNDYTYINKILTSVPFREKRQDAGYTQWAAMQEAYFRLSPYTRLTAVGWYQENSRMLPQPLGLVNTSHEKQWEVNARAYAGLDFVKGIHALHLKTAWLYYRQNYDKWYEGGLFDPEGNRNKSQTWQAVADYSVAPCENLVADVTVTYGYDRVRVCSYMDIDSSKYVLGDVIYDIPKVEPPVVARRNVVSLQASVQWSPLAWLAVNGQYMFERNDSRSVSTGALGVVTNLLNRELQLKGSVAYNYRFPSMNDLYWRPGGNPDVRPEKGYSYDMAVSYRKAFNRQWAFDAEAAGYMMYIDDWILWLPKDGNQWIWTPQNHRNVRSVGTELYGKLTYAPGDWRFTGSGNFSWSQSRTRKKKHTDDGSYLKQIPYVPRFKWNLRAAAEWKGIFFSWQITYIGRRFTTTDEEYATDPYPVHNLTAGYGYRFRNGMRITPQLRVDNLFDKYYESTQYYPMPLRNCLFSMMWEF